MNRRLPSGIENFADLRRGNYYYVDKTMLIKELLDDGAYVSLFTRPRRFGKSLTMSMLKCFFEIGADKSLFDGLKISEDKVLCEEHMGRYPVISVSLKLAEGRDYDAVREMMWNIIKEEADRFAFLADSAVLDETDKEDLLSLRKKTGVLETSLKLLSRILSKHYGEKVLILIDEYDVPLEKASSDKLFYDEMLRLVRMMFSAALKTNDYLQFAVVTGCLRVSRESIFTGINNFSINGIADVAYDDAFGFSDDEVKNMLEFYQLSDHYEMTREWYDGYRMGNVDVYCPWDVVSYVRALLHDPDAVPENFWANTSSNDMITRFTYMANADARAQIECLMRGGTVEKKLELDLTYSELYAGIDNLWSVLYTTGYLTGQKASDRGYYELSIPNREIHAIFTRKIDEWFTQKILDDDAGLNDFFEALDRGDADRMENCLTDYMADSISYLDGGRTQDKETFYHGLLIGMLSSRKGWDVRSNREGGNGRPDIIVMDRQRQSAVILEVKYTADDSKLDARAQDALRQIEIGKYDQFFGRRKIEKIDHYGIAFCKKECRVLKG